MQRKRTQQEERLKIMDVMITITTDSNTLVAIHTYIIQVTTQFKYKTYQEPLSLLKEN